MNIQYAEFEHFTINYNSSFCYFTIDKDPDSKKFNIAADAIEYATENQAKWSS